MLWLWKKFFIKSSTKGLENYPIGFGAIANIEKRFYIQEYYKRNVSDLVVLQEDDLKSYIIKICPILS